MRYFKVIFANQYYYRVIFQVCCANFPSKEQLIKGMGKFLASEKSEIDIVKPGRSAKDIKDEFADFITFNYSNLQNHSNPEGFYYDSMGMKIFIMEEEIFEV